MKLTDKQLRDYVAGKLALPGEERDDLRKQIGRLLEKLEAKIHEDGSYRIKKFRRAGSLEKGTSNRPRAGKPVDGDVGVYFEVDDPNDFDVGHLQQQQPFGDRLRVRRRSPRRPSLASSRRRRPANAATFQPPAARNPKVSCGPPAAQPRRSQAINSTAMPVTCASAAWCASRVCSLRPVAFAVAMISRSVALVVRPAERAPASTSP